MSFQLHEIQSDLRAAKLDSGRHGGANAGFTAGSRPVLSCGLCRRGQGVLPGEQNFTPLRLATMSAFFAAVVLAAPPTLAQPGLVPAAGENGQSSRVGGDPDVFEFESAAEQT